MFDKRWLAHGFMGRDIKCFFPKFRIMLGYALTLTVDTTTQQRSINIRAEELLNKIKESPKPVVMVIKAVGPRLKYTVVAGEIISLVAKKIGAVGLVTDGAVRDLKGIEKFGFHVFAKGVAPSHGTYTVARIGKPVTIDGVPVKTGDLIHGDENGVIRVPWNYVRSSREKINEIISSEKRVIRFLKSSKFSIEGFRKIMGRIS